MAVINLPTPKLILIQTGKHFPDEEALNIVLESQGKEWTMGSGAAQQPGWDGEGGQWYEGLSSVDMAGAAFQDDHD